MERSQSLREIAAAPLDLTNGVVILKSQIETRARLEAEIEEQAQRVRDMMQRHIGETFEMEGQASTYFKPGEDFAGIPHHFEDWHDSPARVTTGFRPMTILGVTEGVVVEIEGVDRYPVVEPHTISFKPPQDQTV